MTLARFSVPTFASAFVLIAFGVGAQAAELPLTRVVLSNAGLGQFTRSGAVTAGAEVDLSVRLDQVDDVLKSLTIFDKAGAIGVVSLPGKAPLTELFKDLPFGPKALTSQAELLNALVGAEVEIEGPVAAKGRVFHVDVETTTLPNNGGAASRHRLTLMTDKGFVQAILEDVTALRFSDAKLQAEIARALSGLAENDAKDSRRLSVNFAGEGEREAAISYIVAAPVWKTSYRLVLPAKGGDARLQGWAVLETLTGGDWSHIDLTLVSGNPIAFRQPLYTALFADRIEIPTATSALLKPSTDEQEEVVSAEPPRPMRHARVAGEFAKSPPLAAMAAAPAPAPPPELATAANAAEAEEASTQVLYRFPAKVSLENGHTLMAPIIDRPIVAERVWLYQPSVSWGHPFAAVRLRNTGDAGIPPGLITAFETDSDGRANFVGDAQLPLLAKGATKFVTFALDTRTDIRREDAGTVQTTLGKASRGVLTIETRSRRTLRYEVAAPADEDRVIVVEEAREDGWAPASEMKDVEKTPSQFRYSLTAAAGKTTNAALVLQRADSEIVELSTLEPSDVLARLDGLQNASAALKDAVAKLSGFVEAINATQAKRDALEAERTKIGEDQTRLRENLKSVGPATDLGRRYIETLKAQEDRFGEIAKLDAAAEKELAAERQSAADLARGLTLD